MLINHANPDSYNLPDSKHEERKLYKQRQQKALEEVGHGSWEIIDSIFLDGSNDACYEFVWFTVVVCQNKETHEVKTVVYEDN